MSNKKKVAAIAAVKTIVESHLTSVSKPLNTPTDNWSQWGKQTIMINRNAVQMRANKKK